LAVYTDVSDEQLRAFMAAYDCGELESFTGIAEGVENSNFMIRTDRANYILTLYERRVRRDELPFFLGLMDHLAAAGVHCPVPLKTKAGEVLRELCGRPAALVTFLEGMWPRRVQPIHCAELGQAMARLHEVGRSFTLTRPNRLSVEGWRELTDKTAAAADTVMPGLAQLVESECVTLERIWPSGLPSGVIHGDMFPDNVFFRGDKLSGILDFYFACNEAFAYDLAIALNAWCFDPDRSFNVTKAQAVIGGYERVRPLLPEERQALVTLARGSALRFLLTRLFDWLNHPPGALVKRKDPLEYLAKLRFHQNAVGIASYGLS
jgi:homoserine kinase type II